MRGKAQSRCICMFVTNDVFNDPRVQKEALSATEAGFRVIVLGLKTKRGHKVEHKNNYTILRVGGWLTEGLIYEVFKNIDNKFREMAGKNKGRHKGGNFLVKRYTFIRSLRDLFSLIRILAINFYFVLASINLRAEIYHANDADTLLAAYIVSRIQKKYLIYDIHEVWFRPSIYDQEGLKLSRLFLCYVEKLFARRADKIITVNHSIAEEINRRYKVAAPVVVRNCATYKRAKNEMVPKLRDFLNICKDTKIILYQGRYVFERGLEELIDSSRYLKNAVIVFRGYGPLEGLLREKVKEDHLEEKVKFMAAINMEQLVAAGREADIGVIPYKASVFKDHKWSFPNKFFEYLMAGLAIGSSDLIELRKICLEYNVGRVFNASDPIDIARVLNEMVSDERALEEMKTNARRISIDEFNWEKESEKLINCYRELTG